MISNNTLHVTLPPPSDKKLELKRPFDQHEKYYWNHRPKMSLTRVHHHLEAAAVRK